LDGDARATLRAAARQRAVENYSVEANAAALGRVYERLTCRMGSER
jgi:glycosyltransferase involved in cell wall biosynthesis